MGKFKLKDVPALHYDQLNEAYLEILEPKHREAIMLIVQCCGSAYYYKKAIWEQLWRYDLVILNDLLVFFGLQELFEFCYIVEQAIEVKTLESITRMFNISLK